MDLEQLILRQIEEEEEREILKLYRIHIRDTADPFAIPEGEFIRLYKFTREAARELIRLLDPFLTHSHRAGSLPPHVQVLSALNFFSSGSYQRKVGQDFLACMSQSSVSAMVHRVSDALNALMDDWIKFPSTEEEIQRAQTEFWQKYQFPGVIGVIDGTHVSIVPLDSQHEHLYINRKRYHSINAIIVCDANMRIIYVNAAHGGRTHDSRVFAASILAYHLHVHHEQGRRIGWLLGDSGYPLLPYLLTPLLNQPEGTPGWAYTRQQIHVRSSVERVIGLLKGVWRCLRKERGLHYAAEDAGRIINACCVLHNMRRTWRLNEIDGDQMHYDDVDGDHEHLMEALNIEYQDDGVATRNALINRFYALQ